MSDETLRDAESALHSIDWRRCRDLAGLAQTDAERRAIDRLEAFDGTDDDVRLAAEIYRRSGRDEESRLVLEMAGLID